MEAPEKIYLTEDNPSKEWYRTKQVGFDSIEYTHTDVFIEKACKWLKDNLPNWVDSYKEDIIIDEFCRKMEE